MIKNHLFGYGRLLLTVFFIFTVTLMAGCCEFCDLEENCPQAGFINPVDCTEDLSKDTNAEEPKVTCEYDGMDIVYAFKIPTSQGHCPKNTTFVAKPENDGTQKHDGGAGVIDRERGVDTNDGGAGVIDREGKLVTSYCLIDCEPPEQHVGDKVMVWAPEKKYDNGFIVVESGCN